MIEDLKTSEIYGISDDKELLVERESAFDTNQKPKEEPLSFCGFVWEALQDKIIIILICASVVSITVGVTTGHDPAIEWIDGFAIVLAVVAVTMVGSVNNYRKEAEFRRLKKEAEENRNIFLTRSLNGQKNEIAAEKPETELLVGDLITLKPGISIPVDCILVSTVSQIKTNESAMTGEMDNINKATFEKCLERREEAKKIFEENVKINPDLAKKSRHHEVESPLILSGTQIAEGNGTAIVLAVGSNSENGKIRATIEANKSGSEGTPLEQKLNYLADMIGIVFIIINLVGNSSWSFYILWNGFKFRYQCSCWNS